MFVKAVAVLAFVVAVNAGNVQYLNPSVGAQSELTIRGNGGLSTLSKHSKAVDSTFSSVRQYDSRATNAAVAVAPVAYAQQAPVYTQAAPVAYAQQAPVYTQAAPVAYAQQAPVYAQAAPVAYGTKTLSATPALYAQPAVAKVHAAPVAYAHAAPVAYSHAQPAVYAHQPAVYQPAVAKVAAPVAYAHAAPVAYSHAQPAVYQPAITKTVAPAGLLGVAYSAVAPGVATLHFDGFGVKYAY